MPNKPRAENRARPVRIEDGLWSVVQGIAREGEITPSEVVREAVRCYVKAKSATDRAMPPERVAVLSAQVRDALYLWSSERTKMLSGVADQVAEHIAPTIAEFIAQAIVDREARQATTR